jgi:hypothetical protein
VPTFTPPVLTDTPPILPESQGVARALFRYFPNRKRYATVYLLSDGTYRQDTGTSENENTAIPLPWDPSNPSAPYTIAYYYDYTLGQHVQEKIYQNPYIVKIYQGVTVVSTTEAAALTAGGYGDCIT